MYTALIYTGVILASTAIATVIYNAFKPSIKGWRGERKVNKVLKKLQKQKTGKSIKDITLLSDEGLSTQIDNIFINKSGVFIIEAKNYSGIISGEENSHKWKQQIGKKDYIINNFARQNMNHIKVIQPLLSQYPALPIYSFLSFNPDCELNLNLTRTIATRYNTLGNAIKIRSRNPIISDEEVRDIYIALKTEKAKNMLVSKTHVSRLKLQQDVDEHAKNMNMSKEEYTDVLIEKYKSKATDISKINGKKADSLDSMLNHAASRTNNNLKTPRSYGERDRD